MTPPVHPPLIRSPLTRSWILLVAFTLATLAVVLAGEPDSVRVTPLIFTETALMVALGALKAWVILRSFIGLRTAPQGWQVFFALYLLLVCGAIFLTYAVGAWPLADTSAQPSTRTIT